jgi:hypothetical protein
MLKISRFFQCACAFVLLGSSAQASVYYISPNGDDSRSGLSVKEAWKTLDKVNQVTFQPGDKVLFESGRVWNGQLKPRAPAPRTSRL